MNNRNEYKRFKALAKSASSDVLVPLACIDILYYEEDYHEFDVDLRTRCVLEDESEFLLSDEENSCSATAHSKEDESLPYKRIKLDLEDDEDEPIKESWDYKRHEKKICKLSRF